MRRPRWFAAAAGVLGLVGLSLAVAAPAQAYSGHTCDIDAQDGAPCVAAHSTVRALYAGYGGALYRVTRASDGTGADIGVVATGSYADAAAQDAFCAGTRCTISTIYDQSGNDNDLTVSPPGGVGGTDQEADAAALPITLGGHEVYGVYVTPGVGYRHTGASGVATNGAPESMYMVASGSHVNDGCCFDYGNAEIALQDTGNGHMDAVNLSTIAFYPPHTGDGPWVQADLENGVFPGNGSNTANLGNATPFVTAMLKNDGQSWFALKGADAQSGSLSTWYSGALPSGYGPMHQEGSIILGVGGDNSNASAGSFFEGVMTAGVPSDAADDAVQADIVAAGYASPEGTLTPGGAVSLRATTPCCTTNYIRHAFGVGIISPISGSSPSSDKADATFVVRSGLASAACVSFEARQFPGSYLRHANGHVLLNADDGTGGFAQDATFCPQPGMNGQGTSFASYNFPTNYIRHYQGDLYIAPDGGPNPQDTTTSWADDVSFVVTAPWA